MINILWLILIIISIIYSIFTNNLETLNEYIINTPINFLEIILKLGSSMIFWNGILNVCKEGGFFNIFTKYLKKLIQPLFKEIPSDSLALDYISANITANIFGLANASTPMGLNAMKELQKLNKNKEKPSKSMITLIILNITGFSIIPSTIISLRKTFNAKIIISIIPLIILANGITTLIGILINFLGNRK